MSRQAVDSFMTQVLADEGWMSRLAEGSVERLIARLEDWLPAGGTLSDQRAAALRRGLHGIADLASALGEGRLDEATLVDTCLRLLEASDAEVF